jgi:hypothetical protein
MVEMFANFVQIEVEFLSVLSTQFGRAQIEEKTEWFGLEPGAKVSDVRQMVIDSLPSYNPATTSLTLFGPWIPSGEPPQVETVTSPLYVFLENQEDEERRKRKAPFQLTLVGWNL